MSTDFETQIPEAAVDEERLTALVGNLASVTGQPIQIKKIFIVSTPDASTSFMLDNLRDAIKNDRSDGRVKKAAVVKIHRKRKAKPAKEKGEMGAASWRREDTAEIFSTRALHKLVPEGHFPLRTRFVNSKGEFAIVLPDEHGQAQFTKEPKA